MYIFTMTADIAMEFYRRAEEQKATTPAARQQILVDMTNEGLIKSVSETKRSKEEYIKDMSQNFKILDMTKPPEHSGD